jgi:hypothetical protein
LHKQFTQSLAMGLKDAPLATRAIMPWTDFPSLVPLTQQLLDHPQRYPKTPTNFLTRSFLGIISGHDSFS